MGHENCQKSNNEKAEKEFFLIVERDNIDLSDMDMEIVKVFFATEKHLSVNDFRKELAKKGLEAGNEEVKAVLDVLMGFGFARRSEFEELDEKLYEHMHLTEHHDHMVCIKCKKIIEFFVPELEEMQAGVATAHHFRPLNHCLQIYGICGDCLGKREPLIPLSMASPGEKLIMKDIRGGESMYLRLVEMGLTQGAELEVITNSGQVIISVKNTRLAIGRGMASKIYVGSK